VLLVMLVLGTAISHGQITWQPPSKTYPSGINYQASLDRMAWAWDDRFIGHMNGAVPPDPSPYEVSLLLKHDGEVDISIVGNGKVIYTWAGDRYSVFGIRQDQLYYVQYDHRNTGGSVVAVDLKTGNALWRSALVALSTEPPKSLWSISNRITIDVSGNGEVISVEGREIGGCYIEFKDADTGETVAHKVFPTYPQTQPSAP
jgi:hypothetical protein